MNSKIEHSITRIQELQLAFSQSLTLRIDELQHTAKKLNNQYKPCDSNNAIPLQNLYDLAHKLAGSAGTFQFTEVSNSAKKLELFCHSLLNLNNGIAENWFVQIQQLQDEIRLASIYKSHTLTPISNIPNSSPYKDPFRSRQNKIILVDDDELVSLLIQEQANHFGYQISCINDPDKLSDFLNTNSPEVILMDIVFPNHAYNGIDLVNQLKAENKIQCPVIFLSNREDFDARLEAVRTGGNGYIVKPINILELIETLDRHTKKTSINSHRALIIDDDPIVAHYYKTVLTLHNFTCEVVTTPLSATEVLVSFQPDIILLDINMPGCSGFEVAEVIRQDNRFTHIPILFLTAASDHNLELEALKAGGDCFLSKTANKETFITNVISHSQRSKELHAAFDRLKKDEVRFQAVSHSSSDAIITLNQDGLIILWNEGAENIFGYQSIEVIGQSIEIIIPQQHQEKHKKGFEKLISNNSELNKHSIETEAFTKSKKLVSIELTYTEWLSGNDRFFTSIIRDTTQRKKIENELKNQQENLKAIVSNSAEGIITIDDQGIIEMANPKAIEIFAYSASEMEGKNISMLMPKAMRHQHGQYLKHSEIHSPKIINKARELEGLRKGGSTFPMELNVSPMIINGVKKYVGILHDITERKNALEAITSAKLEAENANQAKSQFLSSMSHELRTPLNAVLGFSQLLQEDKQNPLDEDQKDSLEHIYSAGQHLLTLIDEILDLSKIESGKININLESINLIKQIKQSLEFIHPFAHNIQIKLEQNSSEDESIWIKADTFRLNQVLSNLLSNAIKYNKHQGSISIWITQSDDKVRIFIKDTGQGIPDNMMKDLFKPFSRLGVTQSEIEGTGIGLTITKVLVEMMGGTIGVENCYGKGCTFWVELEKSLPSEMTHNATSEDHSKTELLTPKTKILYIEDNSANRLLMKKVINNHTDFQYNEAYNGEEGIKEALKIRPQIILLDISLPDMDGYDVFKQLKKHAIDKTAKVIVVSANAMPEDITRGQKEGFFDYITKPIDQQKLLTILKNALNLK